MEPLASIALVVTGFIAGVIDSIAGGGGILTLPALTLALGAGASAIGSNKIVGFSSTLVAALVYLRTTRVEYSRIAVFGSAVGLGSWIGSQAGPLVPAVVFQWMIYIFCPLAAALILKKDGVLTRAEPFTPVPQPRPLLTFAVGLAIGFYDGFFGPGGGTWMLLGLLFVVKVPLLESLALSKIVNCISAGVALIGYTVGGHVHWWVGSITATGMCVGAFFGARFATKHAAKVVRPALVVALVLLLLGTLVQHVSS